MTLTRNIGIISLVINLTLESFSISYSPARTLRSGSKNLLEIPPNNLKSHGKRSFSVAAPTLWNAVPQSIKSIMAKIETFKSQLKNCLFEKHFGRN